MFDLIYGYFIQFIGILTYIIPIVVVILGILLVTQSENKDLGKRSVLTGVVLAVISAFLYFWTKGHDTSDFIVPLVSLIAFYVVTVAWAVVASRTLRAKKQ